MSPRNSIGSMLDVITTPSGIHGRLPAASGTRTGQTAQLEL